jgi:hypothetical protein
MGTSMPEMKAHNSCQILVIEKIIHQQRLLSIFSPNNSHCNLRSLNFYFTFFLLLMSLTDVLLESVQVLFVAESYEFQGDQHVCFLASLE